MNFWRLLSTDELSNAVITGSHLHALCLLAMLIAIMAAWVLLPIIDRFHNGNAKHKYYWLVAGSVVMGTGVWAMHFCSMLAYRLPLPIRYDPVITLISILPAALGSGICILLSNPKSTSVWRFHAAAIALALGIGVMHYSGMEAILVPAGMYYRPAYFFFSLVAAYLLALLGLYMRIRLGAVKKLPATLKTFTGSVILGLAVSSMHYIGMRATYFLVANGDVVDAYQPVPYGLVFGVTSIGILLPLLILLSTFLDRRMTYMGLSLEQSERRFMLLAETTKTAIFTFNDKHITYANPALSQMLGLEQKCIAELTLQKLFSAEFDAFAKQVLSYRSPVGKAFYKQLEIFDANGKPRWLSFSATMSEENGEPCGIASAMDISEQKKNEMDMRHLAYSDQLTQLANRALFMDRLQHHLDQLKRRAVNTGSYVLFMDINRFKEINDSFGHQQGDKVLIEIAARLKKIVRKSDTLARLGGDEFILLAESLGNYTSVPDISGRLLETINRPIDLDGASVEIFASMGVLELSDAYTSPDQVLNDADLALYRAKRDSEISWVLFDEKLDADAKRAKQLQTELKAAINNRELQLYYQPIICARTGVIEGFEALARWQRRNGEWVSPVEFIPLAEKNGMVTDLTLWAFDEVARQLAMLNGLNKSKRFYISVNTAPVCFDDERMYRKIDEIFHFYQFDKGQLKLELTESTLMKDSGAILEKLKNIIDKGCELMIDDFGTGYSSLSYLHLFPVCAMKIDRSFVTALFAPVSTAPTVKTIIALARSLNMKVVSEGVETEQQSRLLTELGSNQLQGYLFSKPVPKEQLVELAEINLEIPVAENQRRSL